MLNEDEFREAILLVFANKQDLPGAMSSAEVTDTLGLRSIRGGKWFVQGCTATTADGLLAGFEWLRATVDANT